MAKTLQLTFADRVGDALFIMLLRAGVKRGTMSLLTVHGRKRGSHVRSRYSWSSKNPSEVA